MRRNLDRKDKVYLIRSKVDDVIKKSAFDLQSKSPSRARKSNDNYLSNGTDTLSPSMKRTYLGDSMNARGSPLRRVHFNR